jgi:membrane protein
MASNTIKNALFVSGMVAASLWLKSADAEVGVVAPSTTRAASDANQNAGSAAQDLGREATTPSQLPARGWRQILKRVFAGISEDALMAQAASVTFYALLALFPAMAALVSLFGLVADPKTLSDNVASLSGVMPGGGMQIITDQLKSLASSPPKALGLGLVIGLGTSLWSANAGIKSMFDALNAAYHERETRSFARRTLISLGFTLGMILFLVIALAGLVALPAALAFLGLGDALTLLLKLARWPVLLVVLIAFLSLIYRYGPSRRRARCRWVSWGATAAAIAWLVVSVAFSFYVEHFGSYNKTYGSLGAMIGFMTWMWLSATVVLVGAELNAEMEHQTARDTTTGPEKPLGARHATKADTVAAA